MGTSFDRDGVRLPVLQERGGVDRERAVSRRSLRRELSVDVDDRVTPSNSTTTTLSR
jgi:hypothetical protein